MKNTILIAGAGGFIGGELVNYFRKNSNLIDTIKYDRGGVTKYFSLGDTIHMNKQDRNSILLVRDNY